MNSEKSQGVAELTKYAALCLGGYVGFFQEEKPFSINLTHRQRALMLIAVLAGICTVANSLAWNQNLPIILGFYAFGCIASQIKEEKFEEEIEFLHSYKQI